MADIVGPFDTVPWSQAQWYAFAPQWAPSGIVGVGQTAVTAGPFGVTASALSLTINAANQASKAWVRGAGWQPEATTKTKTAAANTHGSLSRRDRLVIRRDLAAQTVALEIIQGTPAGTPSAPALTQVEAGIWEIPVCSFLVPPASGTTLSGFVDEREWLSPVAIDGKAWRTAGAGPAMVAGAPTVVDLTTARLSGGFTFDNANNTLTVPQNGFYALEGLGYATGGTGYTFDFRIVRQRSAVSDLEVASSRKGRKLDAFDESEPFFNTIPLQAGDKLLLRCYFSSAAGTYYGLSEIAGVYLAARYVGPLSGATPV